MNSKDCVVENCKNQPKDENLQKVVVPICNLNLLITTSGMESSEIHLGFSQEWKHPDTRHPFIFTCLHHKQVFRWWPFDRMIFLAVLKFSVTSDQEALQIELLVYRLDNKKTDAFHCWEKFVCFQWRISVEWHNSVGHSTLYTDDDVNAVIINA